MRLVYKIKEHKINIHYEKVSNQRLQGYGANRRANIAKMSNQSYAILPNGSWVAIVRVTDSCIVRKRNIKPHILRQLQSVL